MFTQMSAIWVNKKSKTIPSKVVDFCLLSCSTKINKNVPIGSLCFHPQIFCNVASVVLFLPSSFDFDKFYQTNNGLNFDLCLPNNVIACLCHGKSMAKALVHCSKTTRSPPVCAWVDISSVLNFPCKDLLSLTTITDTDSFVSV